MSRGPKTTLMLRRYTDTADGMGSNSRVWADVKNLRGTFWTMSGNEAVQWNKLSYDATHMFIVPYLSSRIKNDETLFPITVKDRLAKGSHIYEIKHVDDMSDRSGWWRLLLKEYVL